MLAMNGWLKSRAHCSYSTVERGMDDVLQVSVSRAYLSKLCNGVISDSLADAHEELKLAIPEQRQLGSDETSFKNNGKPRLQCKWLDLVQHGAAVHSISHCQQPFAVSARRTGRRRLQGFPALRLLLSQLLVRLELWHQGSV